MNSQLQSYFQQEEPHLGNQYLEDSALRAYLTRVVPPKVLQQFEPDFIRFGDRVISSGDILHYGRECERNPPKLHQYNAFGRRIDDIEVAYGWKKLQDIAAEEGFIALGYDRKTFGEWSRLVQYSKIYLFCPSSAVYDCPLAMTDGGTRLVELNLNTISNPEHRAKIEQAKQHFLSRDPKHFWTSGQWMTERTGGSDVGGTETVAVKQPDGTYKITGYKFFTSATTSNSTFLLARVVDPATGKSQPGSRGLSVFYLEMRKPDGSLNNLIIHKLKNKFGTKAVPTAELEITGATGILVGDLHAGVKVIATILNITRVHNAVNMVGAMRRAIAICRDFASRRKVYGEFLTHQPLHLATLADMESEYRGGLYLTLEVCILLGKTENGKATSEENALLRLLTPLMKLFTAKQAIAITTEAMESLGGTGYMEDTDLPYLYRNCQVGAIWEGTTNVLALDAWRAITKENALTIYYDQLKTRISQLTSLPTELAGAPKQAQAALDKCVAFAQHVATNKLLLEATARYFAFALTRTAIAIIMLEQVNWSNVNPKMSPTHPKSDVAGAKYWLQQLSYVDTHLSTKIDPEEVRSLALDTDPQTGKPRGVGDKDASGKLRPRL